MTPTSAGARLLFGRVRLVQSHPLRDPVPIESAAFNAWNCSGRSHQRGLTLFELLIALALISLMALMASGGMRNASPRLTVKLASEQLLADIKRARLEADASNTAVTIAVTENQYAISALAIDRALPRGVAVEIAGGNDTDITIGPGYWLKGYDVTLSKGDAQSTIRIEPVTRRVTLQ